MRLLIIGGNSRTTHLLVKALTEAGHVVEFATSYSDGLKLSQRSVHDVVMVDRLTNGEAGVRPIANLRSKGMRGPILVVSIHGSVEERVRGLRAGADDYLVKPFALVELLARLDALTRRRHRRVPAEEAGLRMGDLEIDLLGRCVRRRGHLLRIHPAAFRMLEYLMRHAGIVISREVLMNNVWNQPFDPSTNIIDVHIARLRRIIDDAGQDSLIETVRGVGYRLRIVATPAGGTTLTSSPLTED